MLQMRDPKTKYGIEKLSMTTWQIADLMQLTDRWSFGKIWVWYKMLNLQSRPNTSNLIFSKNWNCVYLNEFVWVCVDLTSGRSAGVPRSSLYRNWHSLESAALGGWTPPHSLARLSCSYRASNFTTECQPDLVLQMRLICPGCHSQVFLFRQVRPNLK